MEGGAHTVNRTIVPISTPTKLVSCIPASGHYQKPKVDLECKRISTFGWRRMVLR